MKTRKTVISVTAICLATLMLCCGACFGTASYVKNHLTVTPVETAGAASAVPMNTVRLQTQSSSALTANEIYQLACKQVVGIRTEITGYNMFGQVTSTPVSGTGFILTSDGYILTNHHVVADAIKGGYQVNVMTYDGSQYPAEIIGYEEDNNDVAVIKIDATGLTPVKLGDSSKALVGDQIYVVGNPLGELTYTMTSGIVSAMNRDIAVESNVSMNMFQLDAAVNSGNSGGPVYNTAGEVIGIVTAKAAASGVEGIGFAVPINDAAAIADELIDHGYVAGKPALGITVTTMTEQYAARYNSVVGAYVYSVNPGSCAEKAGIQQGDVIVQVGDKEITTIDDLSAAKTDFKAGDTVEITVYRNGDYITVTVTFDEQLPESMQPEVQQPDTGSEAEAPDKSGTLPFAPKESPAPSEEPGEEPAEGDENAAGSWEDRLQEFYDYFSKFFGFGADEEGSDDVPAPTETPSESGGYRHFG